MHNGITTLENLFAVSAFRIPQYQRALEQAHGIAPCAAGLPVSGKRGQRRHAEARRKPVTINSDLTSVKIMLNHWRALGLLPRFTRDAITDSLKRLKLA